MEEFKSGFVTIIGTSITDILYKIYKINFVYIEKIILTRNEYTK